MELNGLHHVTAVTGDAPSNVAFYTEALGMRLVKKTVNQDDISTYHLFYGDELGRPGTDLTFFGWPWAAPHAPGAGTVTTTALRVAGREALEWWTGRFDELGVEHAGVEERAGEATLAFVDPEGQRLELVDDGSADATPGPSGARDGLPEGPVPFEWGVRGLDSVTMAVSDLAPTTAVLTRAMGFRKVGEKYGGPHRTAVFEVGPGGAGTRVRLVERPELPRRRRVGKGGVHHVAFRVPDEEEHAAWRERLARTGLRVTPVIDRYYFRSIYFREPGGVLFEIATDGPGFTVDEHPADLGEKLSLPPFLEGRRQEIEAGLRTIAQTGDALR